jgi:hypothetical protein
MMPTSRLRVLVPLARVFACGGGDDQVRVRIVRRPAVIDARETVAVIVGTSFIVRGDQPLAVTELLLSSEVVTADPPATLLVPPPARYQDHCCRPPRRRRRQRRRVHQHCPEPPPQ